jgi:hypothetical protein
VNVPAWLNVWGNVAPPLRGPELKLPLSAVTVCCVPMSRWVQVTLSPTLIVTLWGWKLKFWMLTALLAP